MLTLALAPIILSANSSAIRESGLQTFLSSVISSSVRALEVAGAKRKLPITSLLVTWADGTNPAQSYSDFVRLLGTEPMGFRHYLEFCSYGSLDTSGSFVTGWHRLSRRKLDLTDPSKAPDCEKITRQAISDVESSVDLRRTQSLLVFTSDKASNTNSGAAGNSSFSVRGQSKRINFAVVGEYRYTLQVTVHEFGHVMGLNHTLGSSGDSSWFTGMCSKNRDLPNSDRFFGVLPLTFGAPERLKLGAFTESQVEFISDEKPHSLALNDLNGDPTTGKQVVVVTLEKPTHYYTVESRFFGKIYDRQGDLPGEGVVVNEVNLDHDHFLSLKKPMDSATLKREWIETVLVSRSSKEDTTVGTWLSPGETLQVPGVTVKCSHRTGRAFDVTVTKEPVKG